MKTLARSLIKFFPLPLEERIISWLRDSRDQLRHDAVNLVLHRVAKYRARFGPNHITARALHTDNAIIMLLAIGHLSETLLVAQSHRRPLHEVLRFI